jgi:nitrogen fixation NifU-like protein
VTAGAGALDSLYQEIILDHYRHPRGAASLEHLPESRVHENPTCGDAIKVEVELEGELLRRVRFDNRGCAISTASASLMSELLSGRPWAEARQTAREFLRVMRGEADPASLEQWGDLACLRGVIRYPVRVKCATLAWHALLDALEDQVRMRAAAS